MATSRFWQCYERLPRHQQIIADRNFALLKSDPRYPSLHFKQVSRFWSVRVSSGVRALAVQSEDAYVWFWIGTHAEYDALVR